MTQKEIDISLLGDSDVDDAIAFYNTAYQSNRTKEKFAWEFYNAPAGKAIYVIARDKATRKLVGTQCAIPIDLITSEGDVIRSAKSEDTLVDPLYRGLNIFEKMYAMLFDECKTQGIRCIWGFTPARKPFLRLGFVIPFGHQQALLVNRMVPAYNYLSNLDKKNSFGRLVGIFGLTLASRVIGLKRIFGTSKSRWRLEFQDKKMPSIDSLKTNFQEGFTIKQDSIFLKWRITDNHYHQKIANVLFYDGDRLVGSIIFNHHQDGTWYLITEMYSNNSSVTERCSMFKQSVRVLCDKEKVNLLRSWEFNHNASGEEGRSRRKAAGFLLMNRGISFVWKELSESPSLDPNKFSLSRIATQGVI